MAKRIRIAGKLNRTLFEKKTAHTFMLDEALENELRARYDADSLQSLFYALALDAAGHIDLRKSDHIDINDVVRHVLEKRKKRLWGK